MYRIGLYVCNTLANVRVDEDQQIVEFCNTYDGDVYVKHQIDKYGRCSVNGQTFSSDSDRGSIVKAMFVLKDNGNLHPYTLELYHINKSVLKGNDLAYVTWMAFKTPEKDKVSGLYMVKNSFYQDRQNNKPQEIHQSLYTCTYGGKKYISELPM